MSPGDASRRQFLGVCLLAGGAALAPACVRRGAAGRPPAAARVGFGGDPLPLDFARPRDITGVQVAHLIGDSLVWFNRRLDYVPRLATGWSWSDDHRSLTFNLRRGVLWHDGRPVTAEDVEYTWRAATDAAGGAPDRELARAGTVEAVDTHTVRVRYPRPFSPALSAWTVPLSPRHKPGGPERPVGCGPWRFVRWDRGERVVLEPFRSYYDGSAAIERLELEIVRDYATRYAALRAGRIDLGGLSPEYSRQAEQDSDFQRRFQVLKYRMLYYWHIAWRIDGGHSLFTDPRVRQALTMAIDREGFLRDVAHGFGETAVTSFHPDLWGADPSLRPWPYDPTRARALLAEAGWRPARGDGRLMRGEVRFRFRLTYSQTGSEVQRIAEFVQGGLHAVGVEVDLDPLEWSVFLQRRAERDYQAVMLGLHLDPDPDPFELWHSSAIKDGRNYSGFEDSEVDAWLEAGRTTFDRTEREQLYWRVSRRLHEAQPATFFFYPNSALAVSRDLTGVDVTPLGALGFWPGPSAWNWRGGTAPPTEGPS